MRTLFNKLGITDIRSLLALFVQFIKFGIIGVSNTMLSLGIYYVLMFIGLHYILSHAVAFALSVLNAYYWNSKYVFSVDETNKARLLIKVYASYGMTFLLSTGTLFLMVDVIGISSLVAPIINMFFTVPTNFLLIKFWAFREKRQ